MLFFLAALAQVTGSSPPERIALTIPQPCDPQRADQGEITVCARRDGMSPYRINQPAPPAQEQLPKAALQIAEGVAVAAETEQADVGGFPSNRALIRLKIKF